MTISISLTISLTMSISPDSLPLAPLAPLHPYPLLPLLPCPRLPPHCWSKLRVPLRLIPQLGARGNVCACSCNLGGGVGGTTSREPTWTERNTFKRPPCRRWEDGTMPVGQAGGRVCLGHRGGGFASAAPPVHVRVVVEPRE